MQPSALQPARTRDAEADRPALPDRSDMLKRLEKVLPFVVPPKGGAAAPAGEEDRPRRDWGDALDLVRQAADSVKAHEAHVHEVEASTQQLIERAYEEVTAAKGRVTTAEARITQAELKLKAAETRADTAEERARQAEARAAAAEARAQEAEEWLSRIHSAVVEGFAKPA